MNKKFKKLNAFTLAEGGHSPLLYGDEWTQGSPRFEIWQTIQRQNDRNFSPLPKGEAADHRQTETITSTEG